MAVLSAQNAYGELKKRYAQIIKMEYGANILSKDAETAMAPGSAKDREEQITAIKMAQHHLISEPKVEEWLNIAEAGVSGLNPVDRRNLALMRHHWTHENALDPALAEAYAQLEPQGVGIHVAHYRSGDWSQVRDWYAHSFAVAREVGQAKKDKLGVASAYEALVDRFSPGIRVALIEREFAALSQALRVMIPEALERQAFETPSLPLKGPFSEEKQMELNHRMAKAVGFDYNRGRFDAIKGHPSSNGSPDDNRISTRCKEEDFLPSLFGAVHETGHAMYEQGLPVQHRYQPVGNNLGMAIHESQSMSIEYQACMTGEFFELLAKHAQEVFGQVGDPSLSPENLYKLVCRVQPSFIRVEADELTYSMHVIMRFELEKAIIEGRLDPKDLPEAWNDSIQSKLGIRPSNNAEGCMQDVHWPVGIQGYFPAYTLGAMTAAQFFATATRQRPEIKPEIARGNFAPLTGWLNEHVHSRGSLVTAEQLILDATGEPLNARHYLNHFSQPYLGRPYTAPQPVSVAPLPGNTLG